MFLMIGIWGSRGQKIKASLEFFYFTLFGSILLLIAILWLSSIYGTTNYLYLLTKKIPTYIQFVCWISFFFGFAIKLPLFPFHIWLPKAHVEAPTAGSVLLAGVLLKMGGLWFFKIYYTFIFSRYITFSSFNIFVICVRNYLLFIFCHTTN